MRYALFIIFALCVASLINSCAKDDTLPVTVNQKLDTSTTLAGNTELVGRWHIVSDSVSFQGTNTKYIGQTSDHYAFTTYGNMYVSENFGGNYLDTAIYAISAKGVLNWLNIAVSVNGTISHTPTNAPPYDIRLNSDSLILTSNVSTTTGQRYEQIKFIKQ
jgi:hypothetical protein